MADLEKIVQIIFEGDDRTQAAFSSVTKGVTGLTDTIEAGAEKVSRITDGILKLDAALAAIAIGGLTYAYTKSVDFESAVVELTKVLGADQVEAITAAKNAATELSEEYGVAATNILGATANFVQAGFDIEDAMTLTKTSLDLVIAGDIEAAEASEILISALKGFREPASEAGRLLDILNEISNNYATDVQQLGIGMAALSPIARTMGFSMEETAGILVPVIEIFRSGDEAAVALKTGLLKLVDDSKPVQDALAAIGVAQLDANGALRSGKDILYDVATAFTTLDDNQKLYIAQQLVGINQAARMVEVFDNLGLSTEITATAMGSAGSAAAEVAARLASAEVQIDRFQQSFVNLAVAIGDQFKVAVTEAIGGAAEIEQTLRQMVDAGTFEPIFNAVNQFADRLGEYLREIAASLPAALDSDVFKGALEGLGDALGDLADSFAEFFGALDPTKPDDLADALANLVNIITGVVRVTEGMVDAFRPFAQQVADFFVELSRGDEEAQQFAGQVLMYAKLISEAGLEIVAALVLMREAGVGWADAFSVAGGSIQVIWNTITLLFKEGALAIVEMALAINQALNIATLGTNDYLAANVAYLEGLRDNLNAAITQDTSDLLNGLGNVAGGLLGMADGAETAADKMGGLESDAAETEAGLKRFAIAADGSAVALDAIPEEKKTDIEAVGADQTVEDAGNVYAAVLDIPDAKATHVSLDADAASIAKAGADIEAAVPDEKTTEASVIGDAASLAAAEEAINAAVPDEKDMRAGATPDKPSLDATKGALDTVSAPRTANITAQTDEVALARIKGQLEAVQASIEWKAKLDIAEVEANAKIVEALAETLGAAFSASADIISGAVGMLTDKPFDLSGNNQFIKDLITQQMDIQERAMSATEALVSKQVEFMESKIRAMESGEALIQIDGAGLQPHLEAFMWEILSAVQVRVNEEGHAMLFGT